MNIKRQRILKLIAGFLCCLCLGVTLAWSLFVVPIETLNWWVRSQTSFAFTINTLFFSVGSILTGILSKKISFSHIIKISGILIGIGFYLTSISTNIYILYASYGIIVGMGYNCVISACPLWMPEKTVTATSLLLMGYALSTAVFGPMISSIIENHGIVIAFRMVAMVCGCGLFLLGFYVGDPNLKEIDLLPQRNRHEGKQDYNVITADMVKMPMFWIYYLIIVILPGVGLCILNHNAPMMTETIGVSTALAATVVSLVSFCNGFVRFIFGFFFDKLGVIKSLILASVETLMSTIFIFIGLSSKNIIIYIIGAALLLISYGCNATSIPSVMRELFGHRTFSLNYSILSTQAIWAAFFPVIIGSVQSHTNTYVMPSMLLIIFSIISIMILLFLWNLIVMKWKRKMHFKNNILFLYCLLNDYSLYYKSKKNEE